MTKKKVSKNFIFTNGKQMSLQELKDFISDYEKELYSTPAELVVVKHYQDSISLSVTREMTPDEETVYQELQRENLIAEIKSKEPEMMNTIKSKEESISKAQLEHKEYKFKNPTLKKDHEVKLNSIQVKIDRLSEYKEMLETLRLDIRTLDTKEFEDLQLIREFYRNFLSN